MACTTGSDDRDSYLKRAIAEAVACGEQTTLANIAEHLPADFDLDQAELDGMLADSLLIGPAARQDLKLAPPPKSLEKIGLPDAAETEQTHHDTAGAAVEPDTEREYLVDPRIPAAVVAPKIREAEARRLLDEANQRLGVAREKLVNAQAILRSKRADLGTAIYQWQMLSESATDGLSPEARRQIEVRNHLASAAADRAARRGRGNSATAFVQKRMQNGPSRGAYSRAGAARSGYLNRDPSRGAVPKVPSAQ